MNCFCFAVIFVLMWCPVIADILPIKIPEAASFLSAAAVGNTIVVAGGLRNDYSPSGQLFVFDATTLAVLKNASLQSARYSMAVSVLSGKTVYFVGGATGSVGTGRSTDVDTYPTNYSLSISVPTSFSAHSVHSGNQAAVVAGGQLSLGYSENVYLWGTNFVAVAPGLPTPRDSVIVVSAQVANDQISAFIGGDKGTNYPSSIVDFYNHTSNALTTMPSFLSRPRRAACGAVYGTMAVVIGGFYEGFGSGPAEDADVIDLATSKLVRVVNLTARASCAAAALGPYIYVGGGQPPFTGLSALDVVEVIDMRDFSVQVVNPLSVGLYNLAAAATNSGVFFVGGLSHSDIGQSASAVVHGYRCGNGVLDAGELCEFTVPFCNASCRGCLSGRKWSGSSCESDSSALPPPPSSSVPAPTAPIVLAQTPSIDPITLSLAIVFSIVGLVIIVIITVFLIRYRRRASDQRQVLSGNLGKGLIAQQPARV